MASPPTAAAASPTSPVHWASQLIVLSILVLLYRHLRRPASYAPGPKRLPIIGNAFDVPSHRPWEQFARWSRIYGDLVYLRIFGRHVLVLNSVEAVTDLFENRSDRYCDRPQRAMANLCGFGRTMLLRKQDDNVKRSRRLLQGQLNTRSASAYTHIQETGARILARNLLQRPDEFRKLIRSMATSVILRIAYGYEVKEEDDPLVSMAEQVMRHLSTAVAPNRYWVDAIPSLRFIPSWFPGARFQKEAASCRMLVERFMYGPFAKVKAEMTTGTALNSYVSNLLTNASGSLRPEDEELFVWTAGEIYGAGSDTTISITSSFVLAMILFPEVQRKAQAEIDAAVGSSRFPSFADRSSLPYVNAVVKEAMRWNPAVSTVGRTIREDDIYRGYIVPAGSLIMANVWGITHDEEVYPEPHVFKPERYLDPKKPCLDPRTLVFGFGKRSCVGRHLAENMLYLTLATLLSTFDINPELDDNGKAILPEVEYIGGAISHPGPFSCRITPRSAEVVSLLDQYT